MSLLMDALKRAETNKQIAARKLSGQDPSTGTKGGIALEPLAPAETAPGEPLPNLAEHLDAVDADLASAAGPSPSSARPALSAAKPAAAQRDTDQSLARNAFAVKQSAPAASRQRLWLALGALALGGLALGGYFWYQLSALNGNALLPAARRPAESPMPRRSSPERQVAAVPLNPSTIFVPDPASTVAPQPEPEDAMPKRPPAAQAVPHAIADAAPGDIAPAATPIHVVRSAPRPDTSLTRGHASLEHNDLAAAARHFKEALQHDPNNTDALLALAAIARHQGQSARADQWTRRAQVADPSDPAVQAAVLNSTPADADPQQTESRLKTLLADQPASAELNFALGNLYARQNRWPEAQQAYFNAVAAEDDNPDYLFNLAVSLDHLRQQRPAANYYRQALAAAGHRPAAFDAAQAKRRLEELRP